MKKLTLRNSHLSMVRLLFIVFTSCSLVSSASIASLVCFSFSTERAADSARSWSDGPCSSCSLCREARVIGLRIIALLGFDGGLATAVVGVALFTSSCSSPSPCWLSCTDVMGFEDRLRFFCCMVFPLASGFSFRLRFNSEDCVSGGSMEDCVSRTLSGTVAEEIALAVVAEPSPRFIFRKAGRGRDGLFESVN